MKVEIEGHEYQLDGPQMQNLRNITRLRRETGIGAATLEARVAALGAKGGENVDDDDIETICALIYLARLANGEDLSYDAAIDFPIDAIHWIPEPGDVEAAEPPDPTETPTPGGVQVEVAELEALARI